VLVGGGGWPGTATPTTTGGTLHFPWYTNATTASTTTITGTWDNWLRWHEPVMRTAEEEQQRADQRQRQREEASRHRLAEQARLEGAQDRALELLELILTPEEREWRDRHDGDILVRGSDGGMYEISQTSVHGNVRQIDEHGCVLGRVCVAPQMFDFEARLHIPLADGWIGQYLAIKHNEAEFRARGNWSFRRECAQPDVPILRAA
jgi:hypothetical protein